MQPDAAALLWDARRAAQLILDFVADKTWPEYQADVMLRSAVERQFDIGESLNRLSRADPLTAADLEDLPRHTGPGVHDVPRGKCPSVEVSTASQLRA